MFLFHNGNDVISISVVYTTKTFKNIGTSSEMCSLEIDVFCRREDRGTTNTRTAREGRKVDGIEARDKLKVDAKFSRTQTRAIDLLKMTFEVYPLFL